MACNEEFPLLTVAYNMSTFGGAIVIGLVVTAQFGPWVTLGYLLLLGLAATALLRTVCSRCGYYGRRCALGLGRMVARVSEKHPEDEFFRTASQFLATALLVLALVLPIAGSVNLLATGYSPWRLAQLVALVGLLLAGLIPHPRLVCSHCCQGERGLCPVGRRFWRTRG